VVLPYDGLLYAFGGKGVAGGQEVKPLSAIYVSRDNGLTWSSKLVNAPELPAEISELDVPFAAIVDSDENIRLILGGENGAMWRGRMNKFDLQ
jgi:hypothetical protein